MLTLGQLLMIGGAVLLVLTALVAWWDKRGHRFFGAEDPEPVDRSRGSADWQFPPRPPETLADVRARRRSEV